MKRDIERLSNKEYDLVIVGGGIYGACAAWDAALRGLSVVILEKNDFAHATSANSFRMIHGGIRYLQHADFRRIRLSVKERRALIRVAPHTAYPLPIVIPIYGHGFKGKEILKAGFLLYDLLSFDRNRGITDKERKIPGGRFISPEETLRLFPDLNKKGLTGAAIFYDGQIYNLTRLVLSFILSAVNAGADAENYMEVTGFLRRENTVTGVRAKDILCGREFEIRSKIVLNAAGPWSEHFLMNSTGIQLSPKGTFSRDVCFIVPRRLTGGYALAVQGKTKDPDALISRQNRHLFIVPWHEYTLIGVWHAVHKGNADDFIVTNEEIQGYIDEINDAYPGLNLTLKDVSMWNAGLVLFGENTPGEKNMRFGKKTRIVDHAREHGVEGLVSFVGARYTTARGDASEVIDIIGNKLGMPSKKAETDKIPIYGGRINNFRLLLKETIEKYKFNLGEDAIRSLLHNYGSEFGNVIKYAEDDPSLLQIIEKSKVTKAEIIHAIREEKACRLGDVVFRRTDLAAGEHPGMKALRTCAELMAGEMGWTEAQTQKEIYDVESILNRICVNK